MRLRPLGIAAVLDETLRIYRSQFILFASLAIMLAVPTILIQALAGSYAGFGLLYALASSGPHSSLSGIAAGSGIGGGNQLAFTLLQYPLLLAVLPFEQGVITLAAIHTVMGRPTSIAAVLREVLRRYLPLLLLSLLFSICSLFAVLGVGVFLAVRLCLMLPVVLAEGCGPVDAVARSWSLTRDSWWRTAATLVLLFLLGAVLQYGFGTLFFTLPLLLPGLADATRGLVAGVATEVLVHLVTPIYAIAAVVIYTDRRVRREALDLDVQAQRLGEATA